jgi:hypothetical protein
MLPHGLRNRNTSPRTQRLHVTQDLGALGAVPLIRGKCCGLLSQFLLGPQAGSINQRGSHGVRDRGSILGEDGQGTQCVVIGPEGDRLSYDEL